MTAPEKPRNATKRVLAFVAQIDALLVAIFCVVVSVWSLYDAAYLAHSPNDWGDPAAFDVLVVWIVNIPGCLFSLPLAIFLRPIRRGILIPTVVFALAGPLLLFLTPSAMHLNKERQQKKLEELTHQLQSPGR
jgi:hypothetical protein